MQYGFYFDQTRCIGCHTCAVACKDNHDVDAGTAKWVRVATLESGRFPNPFLAFLFSSCFHCEEPACALACPVSAISKRDEDGIVVVDREKCKGKEKCADSAPCHVSCPAGLKPERYIKLISEGRFKEALDVLREATPFAGILGRVCAHPCESECERGKTDEAVAICSLKRFVADTELTTGREPTKSAVVGNKQARVAIVGSGPAGLNCAYDLARMGYPVTVFEAASMSGGLMRYGIPRYRLSEKVLDNEIGYIEELGVKIRTNTRVNDVNELFNQGYKAIFIGTGAWKSQKLGIKNEDVQGITYALDFLRQINSGKRVRLGGKVVVVGGGSVAIDAARTSVRLGAEEVHLVCLECRDLTSKDRMLAQDREIAEAEEEGVVIHPCLGVDGITVKNNRVKGLDCIRCTSVYDENGRFAPQFSKEKERILADNVIIAIGQTVESSALPPGLNYSNNGTLKVDPVTLQTGLKGVFAGGDVVSGASNIVSAISAGKTAAISIDRYIRGANLIEGRVQPERMTWAEKYVPEKKPRSPMPVLSPEERKNFDEVELGFNETAAIEESKRCLHCGQCFSACPYGSPQFGAEDNPKMQKCDFCLNLGRWNDDKKPICVAACPVRALDAGPVTELVSRYGNVQEATGFTYSSKSKPSIVFKLKRPTMP